MSRFFQLLTLSKTIESSPNETRKRINQRCRKRRDVVDRQHEHLGGAGSSRERYRAKSSSRKRRVSKSQPDAILSMTMDRPTFGKTILPKDRRNGEKMIEDQQKYESSEIVECAKSHNTARERRRDRFNVDLK